MSTRSSKLPSAGVPLWKFPGYVRETDTEERAGLTHQVPLFLREIQQNGHCHQPPIPQVYKLRLREIRRLVRGHRAGTMSESVLIPALPAFKTPVLLTLPQPSPLKVVYRAPPLLGAHLIVPPSPFPGRACPHLQGHPDVVRHLADQGL